MNKDVLDKIKNIVEPILKVRAIELVDLEFKVEQQGKVLRLFIDKEEGVSIEDCEAVNNIVGSVLDAENLIEEHYILEVSSPGLYRELKTEKDFLRFQGKNVKIKLFNELDGQKLFLGKIIGFENDKLKIEDNSGKIFEFDRNNIAKINLEPDLRDLLKGH